MSFSEDIVKGIGIDFDDIQIGAMVGSKALVISQKRLAKANDMVQLVFGHDLLTNQEKGQIIEEHLSDIQTDEYLVDLILNTPGLMAGVVTSVPVLDVFREGTILDKVQRSEVALTSVLGSSLATSRFLESTRTIRLYYQGTNYIMVPNGAAGSHLQLNWLASSIFMRADDENRRNIGIATKFQIPFNNINTLEIRWSGSTGKFARNRFTVVDDKGKAPGEGEAQIAIPDETSNYPLTTDSLDVSGVSGDLYVRVHASHERSFSSHAQNNTHRIEIVD